MPVSNSSRILNISFVHKLLLISITNQSLLLDQKLIKNRAIKKYLREMSDFRQAGFFSFGFFN